MIQKEICQHCNNVTFERTICDECGKLLGYAGTLVYTIGEDFPYEVLTIEGNKYHFCNKKCLLTFMNKEIEKEK